MQSPNIVRKMPQVKSFIFIITVLFLSIQTAGAQKLKEKKDIVYLDDVPQYKIEKTGGSLLKGISYAASTVDGKDTLIRFNFHSVKVPSMPHEDILFFRSFTDAQFVKSGNTVAIPYLQKRPLMDFIYENGLIKDGQVTAEGEKKVVEVGEKFAEKRAEIDTLLKNRDALMKNPDYADYCKGLVKRSRGDMEVTTLNGSVYLKQDLEAPILIGSYKLDTDNNYGTSYRAFKKDGKPIGSIFYEKGRKRLFFRTFFDNKGKEIMPVETVGEANLLIGLQYFVTQGYL